MRFFSKSGSPSEKDPVALFIEKADAKIEELDRAILKKGIDAIASVSRNDEQNQLLTLLQERSKDQDLDPHLTEIRINQLTATISDKTTTKEILMMWHKSSALLEVLDKVNEIYLPTPSTHKETSLEVSDEVNNLSNSSIEKAPTKEDYEAVKTFINEQKEQKIPGLPEFSIMDKRGLLPSDTAKMITELENAIDAKIAALSNPSPSNP